jgi:quercetin dioxygenase-like cupin family protein
MWPDSSNSKWWSMRVIATYRRWRTGKRVPLLILALLSCTALSGQQGPSTAPLELSKESHHELLFENAEVRVFRVELQPGERTLPHRHERSYAYLSLHPVTLANEVRGHPPVVVELEGGEVHTSKGGFTLAERNKSPEPAAIILIEAVKADAGGFAAPIGGFRYHGAAFAGLFQFTGMRGYSLVVAAGGRTEKHEEQYDRLILAISDLKLREDVTGQPSSEVLMNAGDVKWFPRGISHATTNMGDSPATFITFEFE